MLKYDSVVWQPFTQYTLVQPVGFDALGDIGCFGARCGKLECDCGSSTRVSRLLKNANHRRIGVTPAVRVVRSTTRQSQSGATRGTIKGS